MKKKILIISVILIILIGGGLGILVYKYLQSEEEWVVYRNEEYGFEIKYPEDWSIEENPQPSLSFYQVVLRPAKGDSLDQIVLWAGDNPEELDEKSWLKKKVGDRYSTLMSNSEDIKIGGEMGLLITDQLEGFSRRVVYVSKDKKIYVISIAKDSSYIETFNQILSTFKFLD